jgi:type I restriction enzyme, S subunit
MKEMENERLPKGWAWTNLGDLGEFVNGRAFKQSDWSTTGRKIIRIQNLTGSTKDVHYFDGGVDEKYIVNQGDLLVSWSATLGVFLWAGPEAVLNQHIFKVKPKVDKEFLFYLIKYNLNNLKAQVHGTGMQHITKGRFDSTKVALPPSAEQVKIAAKLDELFQKLRSARQALVGMPDIMRRFQESVLLRALRQAERKPITDVADLYNGKAVGSGDSRIRVFKTRHVYPSGLRMDEPTYLEREQEAHIPTDRYLQDNDVLIVNTWQNLGRVCFVKNVEPNWTVDSQIMIVRPHDKNLGKILFHFLNSGAGYNLLLSCERGALTQNESRKLTHIYPKDVGKLQVPVQSGAMLARTTEEVEYSLGAAAKIERATSSSTANLEHLEWGILSQAFRGELVPQNTDDEPASELLRKIGAGSNVRY